jgi:hypothetical protein
LDVVDRIVYKVCPFVAAGVVVGSIYWTAVTYGALTIMQVVGAKEGLAVMEQVFAKSFIIYPSHSVQRICFPGRSTIPAYWLADHSCAFDYGQDGSLGRSFLKFHNQDHSTLPDCKVYPPFI